MLLFWRRLLFAVATVYLFAYPIMQMYAHYFLTFATMIVFILNKHDFESKGQRFVELGSEIMLYFCSTLLCQFMNFEYSLEQREQLETVTLICMGVLLVVNLVFIAWYLIVALIESIRKKKIKEKRRALE